MWLQKQMPVCLMLIVSSQVADVALAAHPPQFAIQHYGSTDGLSSNGINDLLLADDGRLWLATFDGIQIFDGQRFERLSRADYPDLPSNRIIDLHHAADGDIWLRSENGELRRFNGHGFDLPLAPGSPAPGSVRRTRLLPDRVLWVASPDTLYRVHHHQLEAVCRMPHGVELLNFAIGRAHIWIGTVDNGLWRCHDGIASRVAGAELEPVHGVDTLVEAGDGSLLLAGGDQLWHWTPGRLEPVRLPAGIDPGVLATPPILGREPDGHAVASTSDGLLRFKGADAQRYLTLTRTKTGRFNRLHHGPDGAVWRFLGRDVYRNGQRVHESAAIITQLALDREGNIWLATDGDGLYRLRNLPFVTIGSDQGLASANTTALTPSWREPGVFWAGNLAGQLHRVAHSDQGGWQAEFIATNGNVTWSLAETRDGRLWEGGEFLCAMHAGGGCDAAAVPEALWRGPGPPRDIRLLFEDSQKRFWVGSAVGLFVREHGQWKTITQAPSATLRVVLELEDGSLLFGSNGAGLWRFDGRDLRRVHGDGNNTAGHLIRSLYHGPDGWLWIGTEDAGIIRARFNGDQLTDSVRIDRRHGLPDDVIHQILPDDHGRIWANSNRGLFRLDVTHLHAALREHDPIPLPVLLLDTRDGLHNAEGNGGFHAAGFRDDQGRLWFPGQAGIVGLDPRQVVEPPSPLAPRVIMHSADGERLASGTVIAANATRNFRLRIDSPRFVHPEQLRFRYRLSGLNDRFTAPQAEREWLLQHLPPGDFRLDVQVAAGGGPWVDADQAFTFRITPRFVEGRGFLVLLLAGAMLLTGLAWLWRSAALRARARLLARTVEQRTHELAIEKQRVEDSLRVVERQRQELAVLDEAKSRFFTDLSHELRTPLTLILGPAEQMLSQDTGDAATTRALASIRGNAVRLLDLVNQILDLARLEVGLYPFTLQPGDLSATLNEVINLFQSQAAHSSLTLAFESEWQQVSAAYDADAIKKILANLLGNALRHSPPGGRVTVTLAVLPDAVIIGVRDQGEGIPEDDRERVFQRYYRRQQGPGGSGIGLAHARELARGMRGDLEVVTADGSGCHFRCVLPLIATVASRLATVSTPPDQPAPRGTECVRDDEHDGRDSGRPLVLVVEDHDEVRDFIGDCLHDEFNVLTAVDGEEGLFKARSQLPDLIISDLIMPNRDGLSMSQALQQQTDTAGIPIILLSAKGAETTQLAGFESGAIDYLTKPFSPSLLRARLRRLLGFRMRLREQLQQQWAGADRQEDLPQTPQSLAQRARQVVQHGMADPGYGVAQLARALGMSRSALKRALQDAGLPAPSVLIRETRLQQAALLLQDKRGSVAEVAYAVGFASQSHFTTRFREQYGVTPGAYRPPGRG